MPHTAKSTDNREEKVSAIQFIKTWVPAVFYTSLFGSISVFIGSITPGRRVSRWAMVGWCRNLSRSLGIRCKIIGEEKLNTHDQCVFIANHCSFLDILIIGSYLKQDYRWLAKAPLFKIPILGWHLRAAGHIRVFRGAEKARNRDIQERVDDALREGACLLYFPEGTRNRDGHLQPFRKGAFVSAINHNLPLVPIVLRGTGELMRKGSQTPIVDRSKPCTMTVLPAIQVPESDEDESARVLALTEIAQRAFEKELNQTASREEGVSQ